jgi:hypothetical protein
VFSTMVPSDLLHVDDIDRVWLVIDA